MENASPIDSPDSWGAASRGYAERVAPFLMSAFGDTFADRLDIGPDTEVLEVASGSGALTEILSRRAKSVRATDFAPQMIEVLRERMAAIGATNVTFEVMDGQALEIADDSVDRAACSFALMLFPDRAKGFSELHRVLRPGGRALVSAWAGPDRFQALGLFLEAMRRAFPDMPPPSAPPPVFSLADPAAFKAQMSEAGFQNVEVDFVARELTLDGFNDLWGMLTTGAPPVQALIERVGPEGRERLSATLSEIIRERFGNGPLTTENVATVAVGTAS